MPQNSNTKNLIKQIETLEQNKDYSEIIKICDQTIQNSSNIDLIINQEFLYFQCKAYISLSNWAEVIKICEKRLKLLAERQNLFDRYNQEEITKEEKKAFHFLKDTGSELANLAWNSEYRRLENEKNDSNDTLKLAKKKLGKIK